MEDHDYTDETTLPMEQEIPEDSGIENDGTSLESAEGTITPDRPGSECKDCDDHEGAFLKEIKAEDTENTDLDKVLDSLVSGTEPVHVMDRDGKAMVLPMPPEAPVSEILRRAADEDNVPDSDMYRYRLMDGDRVLQQEKSLAQQGIRPGTLLRLEDEMDLTIQGLDGRIYRAKARPSTTVTEFRRQVQRLTGIQPAEQRILVNGKTLADSQQGCKTLKLSDFKVKNGDQMQLVTRTHSG